MTPLAAALAHGHRLSPASAHDVLIAHRALAVIAAVLVLLLVIWVLRHAGRGKSTARRRSSPYSYSSRR